MSQSSDRPAGPANGGDGSIPRLGLSAEQLLTTTRSVRRRLDLGRPVDRPTLMRCLEWAVQAPNGSNRQGWTWVFIDDLGRKRAIADVYRRNFGQLIGNAYDDASAEMRRAIDSGRHLAENLERCPVLLLPFADGRHDGADASVVAGVWGSILPAVWSFVLALREHGLGTAWTTLHIGWGGEREVADIVGAPYERATQVGLFPIAHTVGTDFRPAPRRPVDEVARWNSWGAVASESNLD